MVTGTIFYKMICLTYLMVLIALMCLVGRSGHMVVADQLLITDRLIAGVEHSSVQHSSVLPQINALPINGQPQDFSDVAEVMTELHNSLRFEPSKLDFGIWSIGMARSHTVTLVNQNENKSVYLSSVSGKTSAFYSSFFEAKMVPPQGNTTFNVVFLPRVNGAVTSSLLIHTSFGQAKLLVSGEGRECPYRLKPILGIKAPLNATLTPEIFMYNPHNYPLQILEVYSSGGQFQLELTSGGQDGPKTLWEIPPYATKPVIRIRFKGNQSGNHTAFIRIKLADLKFNQSLQTNENVIVVPVEFEILPKQGAYTENPVVDFQRLTTYDTLIRRQIQLKDSVNSLNRKSHDVVDYVLRDIPGLSFNMKEAVVTLDPEKFLRNTRLEELLVIKTIDKHNSEVQEFSVLIRAEVFKGTLAVDKNATTFITKSESYISNERRRLLVSNQFSLPLAILNVSVDHNASGVLVMTLKSDALSLVLQPNQSTELMTLQVLDEAGSFNTTLHIHTNVTSVSIPVIVCPGTLHVQTLDSSQDFSFGDYNAELNLGIVPYAEMSQVGFIVLQNRNPLRIKLSSWDFKTPQGVHFHTTFIGCVRNSVLKSLKEIDELMVDTSRFKFCSHLEEHDVAAFQIAIKSYISDTSTASLKIWTPFEVITSHVNFKTWKGKIEVEQQQVYFNSCFPGKLCSSDLSIRSTFLKPIQISSINFTDNGITFKDFNKAGSWIAPETTTKVGRIYFEPAKICEKRCYIPQSGEIKSNEGIFPPLKRGGQMVLGNSNNQYFDETELRRRTELFRHLKWYFQTISFSLNIKEIRQFQLYLIIDIEWPKLVSGKQTFPTIEVGKKQTVQVNVTNPANQPILIDYFLSDPKYSKDTQLSLPLEVVDICTHCYLTDKDVFSLLDFEPRKPILVPAGSSVAINIQFSAKEADTYSTLLHIRNNLTLYEAVWVTAKTVQSQFKFGNRKPGSSTPLLFEVNEKHLSSCTDSSLIRKNQKEDQLTIVTKRTFTARNTGELPITIETFMIDDQMCEGFGFKILDCRSFELQANSSKKIEIGFSPDFTSARVSRPLHLITNLSYDVNYLLVAIMPPASLDLCSEVLPRPHWEARYRLVTLVIVGTSFILVMVAAQIDYANLLLKQTDLYMSREKEPLQPTFNLRNIAIKSQTSDSGAICTDYQHPSSQSVQKMNKSQSKNNGNHFSSSGSSNCNLKKRGVKKVNSNGSGSSGNGAVSSKNISLPDITWPLELSTLKGEKEKVSRSVQNFSERSFPLKLEADKATGGQSSSNSSTSISSSESSAKLSPPKQIERTEHDVLSPASAGGKKQKNLKKIKKLVQNIATENIENDKTTSSKAANHKSPKQVSKSLNETNFSFSNSEKGIDSELMEPVSGSTPKQTNQSPNDSMMGSGGGRKYGKTPGRERKKELNSAAIDAGHSTSGVGSKRLDRKQRNKAANALNFNASPNRAESNDVNTFNALSSWNQIPSFSHVLQLQQTPAPIDNIDSGNSIKHFGSDSLDEISGSKQLISQDMNSLAMNNDVEKEGFNSQKTFEIINSTELGPIGSKKSPTSTPVWEPLCSTTTNLATPAVQKPTLSQNSSFFSNLLPSSYGYNEIQTQQQMTMGLSLNGLYELKKAQEELQRQWQTSEYLFNLRQQQMVSQQQQNQAINGTNSWNVTSQTWTPMNYGQNVVNNVPPPGTNTGTNMSSWQRTTAMRPPPGLEQNYQSSSMPTGPHHRMQVPAGNDNPGVPPSPTSAANASANDAQSMQPFDPFSSLSSIWSENWNKNHRNDMN